MVEKSHAGGFWPSLTDPLRQMGSRIADWFAPASEASTNETAYTISLELPGVTEKDVEISVHDSALTVKGEKRTGREETGETWFFSERQYGAFSRSFRLPPDADDDKVSADLRDGVLTIRVPKRAEEEAKARTVKIGRS